MRQVLYPRLNKQQVQACARLNDDLAVAGETIQRWNNASTTPLLRILAQVQELLCELYNAAEVAEERFKQASNAGGRLIVNDPTDGYSRPPGPGKPEPRKGKAI